MDPEYFLTRVSDFINEDPERAATVWDALVAREVDQVGAVEDREAFLAEIGAE